MALSMPNFLTCSLWAVNTVIAEDRLLLWRSRTRPTRAKDIAENADIAIGAKVRMSKTGRASCSGSGGRPRTSTR
jgi:hypothetical protein